MDFISNLIKRPISLVLNETSTTMDKYPISASLPNTPSVLENKQDSANTPTNEEENQTNLQHKNNNRPLSMSSSYNGNHLSDFIGVPEEFLDEFRDILPPPPLLLENTDPLTQSLLDMDNSSLPATPPPPPLLSQSQWEQTLTPSMKASQKIDELLLQINDNLQQAGLSDDVLPIALPSNKSELSPLSSKASLNNTKLFNSSPASNIQLTSKTPTTAADTSSATTVFENNSSLHKFHIDPELETGLFNDHNQQPQEYEQQQGAKEHMNNSGVNKSSNKFVGLTEFDETKIPELPGDLNPNIEEQYNVTFEECFIPTLTAQQGIKVPDESIVDKTHLLLPTETDAISSENETFSDCNDDKDPLANTFADPSLTLDVTTDLESYQSAINNSINTNLNDTMDNIADITMESEGKLLQNVNQTQILEEPQKDITPQHPKQFEPEDEDEPMDIDMNATLEILHNTSNNIQNVEKVLQHAENILQHIEDKKSLEQLNVENKSGLSENQTETSKMSFVVNTPVESVVDKSQDLEVEQSKHELSLNKSIELPLNKSKTLSSECIIKTPDKEVTNQEEIIEAQKQTKTGSPNNLNLSINCMNSSSISNSSVKSAGDGKTEAKLDLTLSWSTSINSQKSSPTTSPSFPIKTVQNAGFPRSPKAKAQKPNEFLFLEKSDYFGNLQTQGVEEKSPNDLNGTCGETSSSPLENNLNGTFVEPMPAVNENNKRLILGVDTSMPKPIEQCDENTTELRNKRHTFSVCPISDDKSAEEKRRTFSVKSNDTASSSLMQFPSLDKTDNSRRTFSINDTVNMPQETLSASTKSDVNSRRTFNVPLEEFPVDPTGQTVMDNSFEPMEVDVTMSQNTTLPMPADIEQISQTPPLPMQQTSKTPPLPAIQNRSQSPPLPTMQQKSQTPLLPATQSPALPEMQSKSQSPPLPTMQGKSSVSQTQQPVAHPPTLPTLQTRSQSPPLPTMQNRSQSPPLPTLQRNKSNIPSLSTAQQVINIKEEQISPPSFETNSTSSSFASQPLSTLIQKRPSIRDARARAADILSAKEQSNIKVKDEKDVFVEKFTPSPVEDTFTAVTATSTTLTNSSGLSEFDQTSISSSSMLNNDEQQPQSQQIDDEFSGNNNLILNPSDFDYLLTKGNNTTPVDRSSLLLKFDPLLGVPVPVNQGQQQLQQLKIPTNTTNPCLSPAFEEDEHNDSNRSFVIDSKSTKDLKALVKAAAAGGGAAAIEEKTEASAKLLKERSQEVKQQLQLEQQFQHNKRQLTQGVNKKNATMSVDVIKDMSLDNDCNKTFENSNSTQSDDKQINYKMDELEKKIKNEVLKTEDIEKKLKDAEQREEALIKRITEKDKTIAKMTGVIEAYEKAIAELIADKEQLTQHYEKQLAEVKADRDSNYHHLTSLETTFSDLHVKYEKSKEMTCQLKESEEALQAEKRKNLENLHLQEQRYDKMKNHAMQQLEIANKKLESLTRDHSIEITKLKALLKKEEIARSSINEQLTQKTKENAELVKICDELISGQGS